MTKIGIDSQLESKHNELDIGFEFVQHETSEQSNKQVCLLVKGSVSMIQNFTLIVNSHVGIAGISLALAIA